MISALEIIFFFPRLFCILAKLYTYSSKSNFLWSFLPNDSISVSKVFGTYKATFLCPSASASYSSSLIILFL
jgi:hypothetical protein